MLKWPMSIHLAETTGRLDRLISEMKIHAKRAAEQRLPPVVYDEADVQTLKHHAEDMIAIGQYVLRKLEVEDA